MSGGRRPRAGRPPDPNALRRERDSHEWLILLPEGRKGDAPDWPLEPEASQREATVWRDLWMRPQAVAWERNHLDLEVGLFVRRFCEAEEPGAKVTLSTLVRQMADSLGLSPVGLRSNRWTIGQAPESKRAPTTAGGSRARLKVVTDEGVEHGE